MDRVLSQVRSSYFPICFLERSALVTFKEKLLLHSKHVFRAAASLEKLV